MTDRIRIGDSATTAVPIAWLNERGYEGEGIGLDGFGRPDRQGVAFARDFDDPGEHTLTAWVGQWLVWDGTNVTVETA